MIHSNRERGRERIKRDREREKGKEKEGRRRRKREGGGDGEVEVEGARERENIKKTGKKIQQSLGRNECFVTSIPKKNSQRFICTINNTVDT